MSLAEPVDEYAGPKKVEVVREALSWGGCGGEFGAREVRLEPVLKIPIVFMYSQLRVRSIRRVL